MMRHYATHYPYPLELRPWKKQLPAQLEGTHDFTRDLRGYWDQRGRRVRTITEAKVSFEARRGTPGFFFTFRGNGFHSSKSGNMVGTP